ncbi:hypothetical protein sce5531 [Sorangium cellulosum So ce56]|uniref:TolB protein n=2 Tax=Sorangium cellulosum TaxID=56 RepID=A9G2W1_SORC5|nr:hypothetical protein sce5531 [Sorangium cellulosum So ce56]
MTMHERTQRTAIAWLLLAACTPRPASDGEPSPPPSASSAAASVQCADPAPTASPALATSPAPSAEPPTAPYQPPPEATAESTGPAPRRPIGTFDDWVKEYSGLGEPEAEKRPPRLRRAKELALASGRIAFMRSGDVFAMDLATGVEAQLTRKTQRNIAPTFLGDGRRIAFLSNRDGMAWRVFLMNADGTEQRPITGKFSAWYGEPSFAISPDGARVAYVARARAPSDEGLEELHLVEVASGDDQRVGQPATLGECTFSPGGDAIHCVAGEFDAEHLLSVDIATRRVRRLPDAGNHMFSAARSLGDRLLFSASPTGAFCCQRSQLFTTALDGTGIKGLGAFWVAGSMRPEVSPKGSQIAVAWSVREGGFGADYRNEISLLDANGGAERPLTSAFPRPFYSAYEPSWAPDDRHLAFTLSLCPYLGCEPRIRSVVVVDTRDAGAVPAFIAYGGNASWSPVP